MIVHLVRHGQTVWNRDRLFQGQSDVELKDLGKDIKKGIDFTKPYIIKVIDWSKEVIKKIKERTST